MTNKLPEQIGVVGLGYVGLPLACAFAKHLPTVGFDIDRSRVAKLKAGNDPHGVAQPTELARPDLHFTDTPEDLAQCDFFVVAVPTPVDRNKQPDLSALIAATRTVGAALRLRGEKPPATPVVPTVVYESTVYPGCTEEVCMPILEEASGLQAGQGFKVGYSPERINPGDPEHTLETIVKVVGGQDPATTDLLAEVYALVVKAGVHKTPDIRTAEAAKVIENIQRDLNIALMNELAVLFHRLNLDTREVLAAARTKWNFLPFEPGLVGGHCIPVDPYYLTHKAQQVGFHPEVILAGRRINDQMGRYIALETIKLLSKTGRPLAGARVLLLGVTFKENVPDTRNTRVVELAATLREYGLEVHAYDPLVGKEEIESLGVRYLPNPFPPHPGETSTSTESFHAVVLVSAHDAFKNLDARRVSALLADGSSPGVLVDVRGTLDRKLAGSNAIIYWRL